MGSMRAWFPSRRSVLIHRGARVMRLSGHVRSGRATGLTSRKARYFAAGMAEPVGVGTDAVVFMVQS